MTAGESKYHHFDALGSTAALTDASGVTGDEYAYKAWGEQAAPTLDPQPYRWVGALGYRYDDELNRHNLRRRDYDSAIARFLSEDPPDGDDDANPYRYVHNQAVLEVDPDGKRPFGQAGTGGSGKPLQCTQVVAPKPQGPPLLPSRGGKKLPHDLGGALPKPPEEATLCQNLVGLPKLPSRCDQARARLPKLPVTPNSTLPPNFWSSFRDSLKNLKNSKSACVVAAVQAFEAQKCPKPKPGKTFIDCEDVLRSKWEQIEAMATALYSCKALQPPRIPHVLNPIFLCPGLNTLDPVTKNIIGNLIEDVVASQLQAALALLEHGSDQLARLFQGDFSGFANAAAAFTAGILSESQMVAFLIAGLDAVLQATLCRNAAGWVQSKLILEDPDFQYMRLYNRQVAGGGEPPECDALMPQAQAAADKARDDMKLVGEIMDSVRDILKDVDPHAFGQGQDSALVLDLILQIVQDVVLALITAGLVSLAKQVGSAIAQLLRQLKFDEAIAYLRQLAIRLHENDAGSVPLDPIIRRIEELQEWWRRRAASKNAPNIPPNVKSTLDALPGKTGKTGPIKEVPDAKALDDLFNSLSGCGKTVNSGNYPGIVKELPDGTIIRMRPGSKSGGATLDITMPDGKLYKVHIKQ